MGELAASIYIVINALPFYSLVRTSVKVGSAGADGSGAQAGKLKRYNRGRLSAIKQRLQQAPKLAKGLSVALINYN